MSTGYESSSNYVKVRQGPQRARPRSGEQGGARRNGTAREKNARGMRRIESSEERGRPWKNHILPGYSLWKEDTGLFHTVEFRVLAGLSSRVDTRLP